MLAAYGLTVFSEFSQSLPKKEKQAQDQRIETEKALATADQQPAAVVARSGVL